MKSLESHVLSALDLDEIVAAFERLGWDKPRSLYEGYLAEQAAGVRPVFVARLGGEFAGYVTVKWAADYEGFSARGIPEIQDLNVLPHLRRQGIGESLMRECEAAARRRGFEEIGLGVGLLANYGSAQRLYFRLGYVPDGRGLHYGGQAVAYGRSVVVDDDLVIYLSKRIQVENMGGAEAPPMR